MTPRTLMVEEPERRHRLGVLLVHGIGRQRRGDTLVRWGEALLGWLNSAGAASQPASRADVVAARLTGDESEPATAEVRVSLDGGEPATWLFVEAWWAESFATPSFGRLVSWSVQIIPWSIVLHFSRSISRSLAGISAAEAASAMASRSLRLVLGSVAGLIGGMLLAPVLVGLLVLLLVVGLLPIPRVRSFVASVQRGLAGSVGDSLVLLQSPIQAAAMRSRVRSALAWMATRCERVAVVAHSQGAAIALEALRPGREGYRPPEELQSLVTFGSGVNKLEYLRWLTDPSRIGQEADRSRRVVASPWPASLLLAALFAVVLWVGSRLRRGELTVVDFWPLGAILAVSFAVLPVLRAMSWITTRIRMPAKMANVATVVVVMSLFGAAVIPMAVAAKGLVILFQSVLFYAVLLLAGLTRSVNEGMDALEVGPVPEGIRRWLDYWATADPVPNGPMLGARPGRPESIMVHNAASIVRDHNLYWTNREEFVAPVLAVLAEAAGTPLPASVITREQLDEGRRRRRARVAGLQASRWAVLAGATAFVAIHWQELSALGERALASIPGGLLELPIGLADLLGATAVTATAGALLVLVGWLSAYLVLVAGWKGWNADDLSRFSRHRPMSRWPPAIFCALAVAAFALSFLGEPTVRAVAAAVAGLDTPPQAPSVESQWILVLACGFALGWLVARRLDRET